MYYAVTKILFDSSLTSYDARELKSLVEKIHSRYKVCIRTADEFQKESRPGIVFTSLHSQHQALSRQIDAITELCELSGFGRVSSEKTVIDDVDSSLTDGYS